MFCLILFTYFTDNTSYSIYNFLRIKNNAIEFTNQLF